MKRQLITSRRQPVTRMFPNIQTNRFIVAAPPKAFGPVGVQLIPNSEFLTDANGWTVTGAICTKNWFQGHMDLLKNTPGSTYMGAVTAAIAVVPGATYTLEGRYRCTTVTNGAATSVRTVQANGLGTIFAQTTKYGGNANYANFSIAFTAIEDLVQVQADCYGLDNGQQANFDYIRLTGLLPPIAVQLPGP